MRKLVIITVLGVSTTLFSFAANGNGTPITPYVETPFMIQEEVASFPGGELALQEYVNSHVAYPMIAKQQGIEGKVIISLEIDENGKIQDIEVIQGIGGGCEEEVVRVLSEMPSWTPTVQAGHKIKAKKIFSFNFQL
jgi:periplasmic protein TonB